MNPRDGGPIDYSTYFLGTPFREWFDVKMLADEEGISIRGLVDQYRLLKSGERHRARLAKVESKGMIWEAREGLRLTIDRELLKAATRPVPVEMKLERELESARARQSLLEERVASLERRLAKLRNV